MSAFAVKHMVPTMMQSSDLDMACETGVSLGSVLLSFERVASPPDRAALVTLLSAGMCAEKQSWEAELRGLRSLRRGDSDEVQDARIAEKAAHHLAAQRFYSAYTAMLRAFGQVYEACPTLNATDEPLFFLGLCAGVLASLHDRAGDGTAGVPSVIPTQAAQASMCLHDRDFWGAPRALRAAVWASVPGSAPRGVDPWQELAIAVGEGDAQGVRLARAFWVQASAAAGDSTSVRRSLIAQAQALDQQAASPQWRLLDSYATRIITHESDKLWTSATGHRTPYGALGTFWDEAGRAPTEAQEDGMLDGLQGTQTRRGGV